MSAQSIDEPEVPAADGSEPVDDDCPVCRALRGEEPVRWTATDWITFGPDRGTRRLRRRRQRRYLA